MITIDNVIAQMRLSECLNCRCESAIYDDTNEPVTINGTFCYPQPGLQMIHVTANNLDGNEVWSKECDTGRTCTIPFTTSITFECH